MRNILYDEIFNSVNCELSIFFEDDFVCEEIDWNIALYRLVRMDEKLCANMNEEISAFNKDLSFQLKQLFDTVKPYVSQIENWNEVIQDDFEDILLKIKTIDEPNVSKIKDMHLKIAESDIKETLEIFFKYGLACIIPQTYENIFKEHICAHGRWRPFLIYNYYNADLFDELKRIVSEHLNETATVCCIIDNDLKGENKANDILNVFEKLSAEKSFSVIGAVVTSHEKIERINENVHIEFVSKDNLELLKTALLKSIYHYLLNVFKIEMLKETDSAIKKAAAHPAVAQYLITMAQIEGISNYEIIYQWILELFEQGLSNNTHIPTLVAISNMLDECANVDVFDKVDSISDIGGFEAFDYNINKFYQPIAPGDVFINSEGRIFVLVGQACDMAMSCTRSRRNGLCELVEAKIEPITSINKKTLDNLVHMWVYNFKLDGNTSALKIDYRKRCFMENEVLSLCSFSNDGSCWIDINNALPEAQKKITQQYLLDYYEKLQKYFSAIMQLKASSEENLAVVLSEEYIDRIIRVIDFTDNSGKLSFDLKRVCRLKGNYILFLYKLFLENRGRIPFETINMGRTQCLNATFYNDSKSLEFNVSAVLTRDIKGVKNLPWIISNETMEEVVKNFASGQSINKTQDEYSLEDECTKIILNNSKKLVLTKKSPLKVYCTIE